MTDALTTETFAALDAAWGPDLRGPLGVAVSGGGDSVALLLLAERWGRARGRAVEVATVDHGLRPESAGEAAAVLALAERMGLPAETLVWKGWDGAGNLQAAARDARRGLLSAWAARRGVAAVALGHTLDDQAETVLMRLGRGAGVDGLSGMAARMTAEGTVWLRPLLGVRRAALRGVLAAEDVAWIDDPSNENPRFDRVRARTAMDTLADLGVTAEGLAATAGRMRSARSALDRGVDALASEAAEWGACGELRLALAPLRAASPEMARRLVRAALTRTSGSEYGPRGEAEGRLLIAMLGLRLGGGRSLHGCVIRPDGPGRAVIVREVAAVDPAPLPPEAIPAADGGAGALWDGRFRIAATRPLQGAHVAPLGEAGARRLAELSDCGDWRADAPWRRAPRAARLTTPALWLRGALTAAPLAGFGEGLVARLAALDGGWPAPDAGDAAVA